LCSNNRHLSFAGENSSTLNDRKKKAQAKTMENEFRLSIKNTQRKIGDVRYEFHKNQQRENDVRLLSNKIQVSICFQEICFAI
jgi:hypothetical protein